MFCIELPPWLEKGAPQKAPHPSTVAVVAQAMEVLLGVSDPIRLRQDFILQCNAVPIG